jgi:hypothetical protein
VALAITLLAIAAVSYWVDNSSQDGYQALMCVELSQDGHCDRLSRDALKRAPAPGHPLDTALDLGASKIAKIVRENYCPPRGEHVCSGPQSPSAPTATDVYRIRHALADAGLVEFAVRLSRPADPTVPGALIYGVPLSGACVMGDIPPPTGLKHQWLAGQLHSGGCLEQ